MTRKYQFDPGAYKRRVERERGNSGFKEKVKQWEAYNAKHPKFNTENEALKYALEKTKKGERLTISQAPKELGGQWLVAPDADPAVMLGWSMIYDSGMLNDMVDLDHIEEV